ncbi:hypothetical protein [Burkholderia plantarii]|uniref:Putative lipoprotein n=1 Tax=Burkholderia plantarii TaxID=41899 RepID=A0A0B6RZX5_BURPL|nr:hypothetical protein [Burkholderia plantarii]AJK46640.1 putative lipoprotein [Burkholderia plantarii]
MKVRTLLIAGALAPLMAACGWFHDGPAPADIDAAVRQALDAENHGPVNAFLGRPLPAAADIASIREDGPCRKTAEHAYTCEVVIAWHSGKADDASSARASLVFSKNGQDEWQTDGVDTAIVAGAAQALVDGVRQALPGSAASGADAR